MTVRIHVRTRAFYTIVYALLFSISSVPVLASPVHQNQVDVAGLYSLEKSYQAAQQLALHSNGVLTTALQSIQSENGEAMNGTKPMMYLLLVLTALLIIGIVLLANTYRKKTNILRG